MHENKQTLLILRKNFNTKINIIYTSIHNINFIVILIFSDINLKNIFLNFFFICNCILIEVHSFNNSNIISTFLFIIYI